MSSMPQTPTGIAYQRQGPSGQRPVLLIHAGVADRRMWDPQRESLTATRDTIRLDLRGFGESTSKPHGRLDHAGDVIETLDHLDIAGCHVVGSSLGSGVAVEVALTRPDLVRSLLLCPPGGSLLASLTPDLRNFFDTEQAALARSDIEAAVDANVATWVVGNGRIESELEPAVPAAVRQMQRNAFQITAAWGEVDEAELEPPALDRLAELDQPMLVLVGGRDLDAIHDAAARVCAGVRQVQRVDWDDVAHLPSMEQPQAFGKLLRDWTAARE